MIVLNIFMKHFLLPILFCLLASKGIAQDSTSLIIPTGPGGTYHKIALELAPVLSKIINETVIVESRPGGNGLVAARHIAENKSNNISFLIGNVLLDAPQINQVTDIKPVLDLGIVPSGIFAKKDLDLKSFKDLINSPPKASVSYGVVNGSSGLSYMKGLSEFAKGKVELVEILYKSGGNVITDVVGGHLDVGVAGVPALAALAGNPRINVLAVLSDKRSKLLPDVPTVFEENIRFKNDFLGFTQLVLWASPGTSADVIAKIQNEFSRWARTPEGTRFLDKLDLSPTMKNLTTPEAAIKKITNQ